MLCPDMRASTHGAEGNETLKKQGGNFDQLSAVLHRLRSDMQNRDHKGRFASALVVRTMHD